MVRATYPQGDTTASRVKTLLLFVERRLGRAEADRFVREAELDRTYLADETRPMTVAVWHRALSAFESRLGRRAILDTWSTAIDGENLGAWARVLRGVVSPEGTLAQLHSLGGDDTKTVRWETIAAGRGRWHGRLLVLHDPEHERDGLCALGRAAELAAIPVLFGLPHGKVSLLPVPESASRGSQLVQEYLLTWRTFGLGRPASVASLAAAAGVAVSSSQSMPVMLGAGLGSFVIGALGVTVAQLGAERRADSTAQLTRIRALERSITLKEAREREAVGFFEGSVVAGKYRLGPKLGAGASGVIHQAIRLEDNAPVAIKLLRAAVAHDSVASDRLRREADALGLTWHPNIVEVYDHDYLPDGTGYLVMEHLSGDSLATRLKRDERLSPAEALPIALQMCDALGAVHAAGVIHRDVKPSNIFLVSSADKGVAPRVKLLDFGIARVEWAETRLTNMGAPLGTPGYMSPEQEQGDEVDGRSDLYALGTVLYECLTGTPPPTRVSSNFNTADGSPVEQAAGQSPSPHIPDGWRRVIGRAMAPLRNDRYRDARSMREALAELATEQAVISGSSAPPQASTA